ncbi:baseplate J/gp47 family protein [Chlorobaculum sp. MV4-Y]|uniref:baseplate J/gp47 family protein n=1 Tax=Chlorobaculum sp. MV4-Y TaxID=2976335 RepID=UPI0021AF259D|nr:baseplate J/gp47 family protein [Chlorobaculum sp. MV4-Y]UWX56716.1 baseplate J/gp47 family protein [Chlorobaculum sp. MV4-Y]
MQTDPNRLRRDGTSQKQRFPAALDPASAPIDGRTPEVLIAFARNYSASVRYYDLNNAEIDNWTRFFSDDIAVRVACASIETVELYRKRIKELLDILKNDGDFASDAEQKKALGWLFSDIGTLARQLDRLKDDLDPAVALKATLRNLIASRLAPAFGKLIAAFKAGVKLGHIENETDADGKIVAKTTPDGELVIFEASPEPFEAICSAGLSKEWITGGATEWTAYFDSIEPNESLYATLTGLDAWSRLARHNLFISQLDLFLKAYARIVADAKTALPELLTGRDDHQPHYALYLAFVQLMELSRSHLNTLTGRHLDFYYKEVLKLAPNASEPDKVHLLFELAKNRESARLEAGTLFKGKNETGQTVQYALDEKLVANRATIEALQAVRHSINDTQKRLYAWPEVNSGDGIGGEIIATDGQWHPFLNDTGVTSLAEVGFAIASNCLLLREGNREITLTLEFNRGKVLQSAFCNSFDFYLSTSKKWVQATLDTTNVSASTSLSKKVRIPLTFGGEQPAVEPMSEASPGNALPASLPMLKAVLKQESAQSLPLSTLQELRIDIAKSQLEVSIGFDSAGKPDGNGLKSLAVSNKFGDLKTDKPFQPFGATPESDDWLIIGSDELFQKKDARFQLRIVWKGLPFWRGDIDFDWVNEFYPKADFAFLKQGSWPKKNDLENQKLFSWKYAEVAFPESKATLPALALTGTHFDETRYTLDSRSGFMKLTLNGDFGHKLYPLTLSRYMMRVAAKDKELVDDCMSLWKKVRHDLYEWKNGRKEPKNPKNFTSQFVEQFSKCMPVEPYTPVIESLTLSYTASAQLSDAGLYQLTPFGCKAVTPGKKSTLLYPFDNEGELYIGIDGFTPGRNLSVLFQLAEGSASPTVSKPEKHVAWSWLRSNKWVDFETSELSDDMAQLTRSGIIRFAVPSSATSGNSLLGGGNLHWLRAVVKEKPEAVCKIIGVETQAARATRLTGNDSAGQLAAESIKKAVTPDASVKKITQPYASFGGRKAEDETAFRTRVSERLRHRNRAITMWDYERLVLEAFPQIYKVKCLNHTRYEPGETGVGIYRELAPGHVTIVAVPNLLNNNAIDPLRPYTSLGELDLIRTYLEKHASELVSLHVENPVFETISTEFSVRFRQGVDEAFYIGQLQQELMKFLSPWAFEEGMDIAFGGKIHKSSLIDFVEERAYVDYVTDFKMYHTDGNGKTSGDLDEAATTLPLSILVSVEASGHAITPISGELDG